MTKEELLDRFKYKPYWRSIHTQDIYRGVILDLIQYINDKDIEQCFRYLDRYIEPIYYISEEIKEENARKNKE